MSLTVRKEKVAHTVEEYALTVPDSWCMFTNKGDKRVKQIAQKAYDKLVAIKERDEYVSRSAVRKVLVTYVAAWLRLCDTKTYREAGDTAVRECVGGFHDELWDATVGDGSWGAWDAHLEEAYERNNKRRSV